ncbi:MAG: alkane 1-monooxygenase [Bacteroidetes bacterium]|nr:alkane 1-monooxygenase [Bacteroidota bacterium]MBK7638604.1 alkane 1-monooxygenase [Bacteroidota bacterium]MBK8672134.1 alkane 1-monooxygenase [Bacteroidota bacterium]MBK9354695.1 alkane 1-monooxygenase [Bacteroidota bacterium]MBL0286812.1 alkane 1-monooxygenase [Bacteroidota bacterium]
MSTVIQSEMSALHKAWRRYKYFLPVVVLPVIMYISFNFLGYWSFFAFAFVYGFIPAMEFIFTGTAENFTAEEEAIERKDIFYDILIYSMVPLQFTILGLYLWTITTKSLEIYEFVGITLAMGLACGALGINVAHELGHRTKKYEQFMAKLLLMSTSYMHFFIEHNRGHHKNVSTPLDPATSRLNQPLYTFLVKSVVGSWLDAWKLEAYRLKKTKQNFWNPIHNEMLRFQIIQFVFTAAIFAIFGWVGVFGFIVSSIIGFTLLEIVNYIEHYGLMRKQLPNGAYEKVKPHHSWNSGHELGRIFLFELTRHSDHHFNPSRKYQILRHFENAPQMPSGYLAMIPLALVPPLWFKIMNPLVEKHNATLDDSYTKSLETVEEVA